MDEGLSRQAAPGGAVSLGGALLDDDAVHELLQQLTVLARHTVLGAHSVSVTVAQGDRYRTSNCTGPEALAVDEAQYDQRGGPCLESMRVKRQLEISVGDGTDRWPRFDAAAREMGVAAVLSTPLLRNGGDAIGALNVYAATAGFADSDVRTTALIGEHATILVGYALALADSSQLNDQLRQAVATRETIGAAKYPHGEPVLHARPGIRHPAARVAAGEPQAAGHRRGVRSAGRRSCRIQGLASVTAPPHAVLETARADVGMSINELWIAYFALGGVARPEVLRAYLGGWHTGSFDYDVVAHAINERYLERGLNHPVPYRDELR